MKKLQFSSNGKEWLLLDVRKELIELNFDRIRLKVGGLDVKPIGLLNQITEEQASEVVEHRVWTDGFKVYHNYNGKQTFGTFTATDSLQSLLQSKGVHLFENPIKPPKTTVYRDAHYDIDEVEEFKLSEEKTFYNPVLFQII